jgi:cytochrome d ubiquinol oxidase subunit II
MSVPLLVLFAVWKLFTGLIDQRDYAPFLSSLAIFVLSFVGIGISFYPNIVPPSLSIWDAAAPNESLAFALYGTVVLVPLILGYTAYAYWVFRGKVNPAEGYH